MQSHENITNIFFIHFRLYMLQIFHAIPRSIHCNIFLIYGQLIVIYELRIYLTVAWK